MTRDDGMKRAFRIGLTFTAAVIATGAAAFAWPIVTAIRANRGRQV